VAVVALAVVAGCSSTQDSSPSGGSTAARDLAGARAEQDPGANPAAPGANDAAPGANGSAAGKAATPVKRAPARDTRAIIYKGEITVRVERVSENAAKASTIATAAGGFVGGDTRRSDGSDSTADLILRVPSKEFHGVVDQLGKLGTEVARGIHTDDVTQQTADLETRIASQRASVDRTRALLARADKIGDIVTIEGELARREADLGSMEAEQRLLEDQVTLSTITVHLVTPTGALTEKDNPGFLSGLAAGWDAFTASVRWLLVLLGAILPFAAVIAVPAVLWLRFGRRRRRTPVAPPAEA
jgi:hypothetical protein